MKFLFIVQIISVLYLFVNSAPTTQNETEITTVLLPRRRCMRWFCPRYECSPGHVLIPGPRPCSCPICIKQTTTTSEVQSSPKCPAITCDENSSPVYDPTGTICPYCETTYFTTPCVRPTCTEPTCEDGYTLSYDPSGCTCPVCQPIPKSTTSLVTCEPKPCPLVTCPAGYTVYIDQTNCKCPSCQKTSTTIICSTPTCTSLTCDSNSIIYDPTGCTCPKCATTSTSTEVMCTKPTCPEITCEEGYQLVEDPTNCTCPTCRCKPRICTYLVRVCDPNNPPPPPEPCSCPVGCIYPV